MINFKSALTMAAIAGIGLAPMTLACPDHAQSYNTTISSPAVINRPVTLKDTTKITTKSVVTKHGFARNSCGVPFRTSKTSTNTTSRTIEKPVTIDTPQPQAMAPAPLVQQACTQPILIEQPVLAQPACDTVNEQPIVVNTRDRHHLFQLTLF